MPMPWSSLEVSLFAGHILPGVSRPSVCKGVREERWWWHLRPPTHWYSVCHLANVRGLNTPHPSTQERAQGTREKYPRATCDHDHGRKELTE